MQERSSFDEIWNSTQIFQFWWNLSFAQTEGGEFNDGNSFLWSWRLSILTIVNIGTCYLLGYSIWTKTANAPIIMKYGKCSNYNEIFYFTQNDGGELNGFDIERSKWVPQRNKACNRKANIVPKMLFLRNSWVSNRRDSPLINYLVFCHPPHPYSALPVY